MYTRGTAFYVTDQPGYPEDLEEVDYAYYGHPHAKHHQQQENNWWKTLLWLALLALLAWLLWNWWNSTQQQQQNAQPAPAPTPVTPGGNGGGAALLPAAATGLAALFGRGQQALSQLAADQQQQQQLQPADTIPVLVRNNRLVMSGVPQGTLNLERGVPYRILYTNPGKPIYFSSSSQPGVGSALTATFDRPTTVVFGQEHPDVFYYHSTDSKVAGGQVNLQ